MKKYSKEDLKDLIGKPVYVKVLNESASNKSGWAILYLNENINAYYAINKQRYPVSANMVTLLELYDEEC